MLLLVGSEDTKKFLEMASPSSSRLARVIKDALRASPDAARLWQRASAEIGSANLQVADQMDAVLSNSENYLKFFMGGLEFAIFPRARRPNLAASFCIENRDIAWGWTTRGRKHRAYPRLRLFSRAPLR